MKYSIFLFGLCWFAFSSASAQQWKTATNRAYFKRIAPQLSKKFWEQREKGVEIALQKGFPVGTDAQSNEVFAIVGTDAFGSPVYVKLYNEEAAITAGTNRVRAGGNLGFTLTGRGMLVGVWDGGGFNENHQEFENRAETRGSISDEPIQGLGGDHSTHVSGTIAAAGIDPLARGMAPETNIFVYDFLDDESELADELAKDEPLLVSNHSYGRRLGWEFISGQWQWVGQSAVSSVEDYLFGFYSDDSKLLDEFAYNAPYYLQVRAAGNDRSDVGGGGAQPPDGPYDIIGPAAGAKNVLTIGAVNTIPSGYRLASDVVMSDFSCWGPTDDGRIKPDLVNAGVDVYSTIDGGPANYGLLSGTSMASPATAGSLILLQQLYSETHGGEFMRAASLKGLVIHAANEAGAAEGPDYEHGWGLLSTAKAAALIRQDDGLNTFIRELTIRDQLAQTATVQSNGAQPLVATIIWTDVPGEPVEPQLDPSDLMLVNDLDIRIIDPLGNEFQPWILDPSQPDEPATKGDNFRDNVEKIEIPNPVPGIYTISITHKGELVEGEQDFSLIVTTGSLNNNLTTFYWVGKSGGEWNDANNWASSSNGAPGVGIPSIQNPVIFDDASFTGDSVTITLNEEASSYNINWLNTTVKAGIELNGNSLLVNGTFNIESELVRFNGGTVELTGQLAKRNSIRTPNATLQEATLVVRGLNARWNMLSDLAVSAISIETGGLDAIEKSVSTSSLNVPFGFGQSLDLRGSSVTITDQLSFSDALQADFENSTIIFSDAAGQTAFSFDGGGKNFHNIQAQGVDLTIEGNNSFNKITVDGGLTFTGSAAIDTVTATPGSVLTFQGGEVYPISGDFSVSGEAGNLIQIQSSGGTATLEANDPETRFCFDYINVDGVSVQGVTDFVSGNNSTVQAGSEGWLIGDCSDALFGSFDWNFPCELGSTEFNDNSTGDPVSWLWNFGDKQFPDRNSSTQQNPSHTYSFPGTYEVTLEISDGTLTRTVRRLVEVSENNSGLAIPSILVDGQSLRSSVFAPNYQWFLDGQPINGAADRAIQVTSDGAYTLEIFNEACKFVSEPVTIGGVNDALLQSNTVLYPNPAGENVRLEIVGNLQGTLQVVFYNAIGQIQQKFTGEKLSSSFEKQFSVSSWPSGMYLVQVQVGERSTLQKFVKE